jgi:hypothetical protein
MLKKLGEKLSFLLKNNTTLPTILDTTVDWDKIKSTKFSMGREDVSY